MGALHQFAVLCVPCAHCGVGAGRPCQTPAGTKCEAHGPRRQSAGPAYQEALGLVGFQQCPRCHEVVGVPRKGWHRCRPGSQLDWIREELRRLRAALVDAVGEEAARAVLTDTDTDTDKE